MKRKQVFLIFILMVVTQLSYSQNLIPNPGFEEEEKGYPVNWVQPQGAYFHYNKHTPLGATNGICFHSIDPTEYFYVRLKEALVPGRRYCFRCTASRFSNEPAIEVYFSTTTYKVNKPTYIDAYPNLYLPFTGRFASTEILQGSFIASEASSFMIVGLFRRSILLSQGKEAAKSYNDSLKFLIKQQKAWKKRTDKEIEIIYKASSFHAADEREKLLYIKELRQEKYGNQGSLYQRRIDEFKTRHGQRTGPNIHTTIYFDDFVLEEALGDSCPCANCNKSGKIKLASRPNRLDGLRFATDSANLKPESYPTLDSLAEFLKSEQSLKILISGHTDSSGNEEHNIELSYNRANAVRVYLIAKGISPIRLRAEGKGSSTPVSSNGSPGGRKWNRRVEFVVEE